VGFKSRADTYLRGARRQNTDGRRTFARRPSTILASHPAPARLPSSSRAAPETPDSLEPPGSPAQGYMSMSGISGMPPPFAFCGFSATVASVVSSRLATLAAFCSAARTTLVGSMTPASTRSS